MDGFVQDPRLVVYKTIYAKVKGTWNPGIANKVFLNEIEAHLRKYPDLLFKHIGPPKDNDDKSKTFPIHFKRKILANEKHPTDSPAADGPNRERFTVQQTEAAAGPFSVEAGADE